MEIRAAEISSIIKEQIANFFKQRGHGLPLRWAGVLI